MASPTTSSDSSTIPLHSLTHLINIKLSSDNYLQWRRQVHSVLTYISLLDHINDSSSPPETITAEGKTNPNPKYISWKAADQKVLLLLHSTLTEEAMAETFGHTSAYQVWHALENAYSHNSLERMHTLRDSLRQLQKGTSTVSEYGRKFKALCDQLTAIGHPVTDEDKRHWFLYGLGASFETFSTAQRTVRPSPPFRDLLAYAESHEIFLTNLHGSQPSRAAFSAQTNRSPNTFKPSRGRYRGSSSRGRSSNNRRPPHCQLCRKDGHYASSCPNLASYAQRAVPLDANLAQAFQAQCNIAPNTPDWTADTGATTHMLPNEHNLTESFADQGSKNSGGSCKRHM
ncbi:putative RNA-directed DNA polymerase [Helianthus debilis subsp. tardiflorus]